MRCSILSILLLCSIVGSALGRLGAAEPRGLAEYQTKILPMLQQFCFDCHADGVTKGDFAFDEAPDRASQFADLRFWDHVRQQLSTHVMPPENKDQPALDQRDAIISWIDDHIFWVDPAVPEPGSLTRRRLNRIEYQNTVRDLLYSSSRPADKFPQDDSGYGFDNIGDVLSISPMLMEKYLRAASELAQEALFLAQPSPTVQTWEGQRFQDEKGTTHTHGSTRLFGSNATSAIRFTPPHAGRFQLKLLVSAQQAGDEPAKVQVWANQTDLGVFDVTSVFTFDAPDWQTLVIDTDLPRTESTIRVAFLNDFYDPNHPDPQRRDRNMTLHSLALSHPPGVLTLPQPSRFLRWLVQGQDLQLGHPEFDITGEDLRFDKSFASPDAGALHLFTQGTASYPVHLIQSGRYRLRITAGAQQAGTDPAQFAAHLGETALSVFSVTAKDQQAQAFTHEFEAQPSQTELRFTFLNDFYDKATKQDRNLWLHQVSLEGPLEKAPSLNQYVPVLALRMASRLFRRPLTSIESARWTKLAEQTQQEGESALGTLRLLLEGMLVSPAFLYHPTPAPGGEPLAGTELIDEFTLASRLAYFLWSAPPDERLLQLAGKQQLRAQLQTELKRMLSDWRNRALAENFAGQWLQLRDLAHVGPDYKQFKDFYSVQGDLKRETETYFDHLIKENRPITELLQSDYTFLNQQLAKFYGIQGVTGDQLQKVSLAGTPRGGILTHASLLTITSNPTRTSPVKRGKFLLETILGTPPPPAPEGVPLLREDEVHRSQLTLREQLAAHRENPSCAGCHAFLDPMGFAFEHYDAVGRYRQQEKGQPIDASGKLVRGQTFKDLAELRNVLSTELADTFTRNLATNLLTYALGRGTTYLDRPALDAITERTQADGWRMQTLILAICESVPFQRYRPLAQ
jgi:hypothetical protein